MSINDSNLKFDGLIAQMVEQIELYKKGKKQFPALVSEIDAGLHGISQIYSAHLDNLRDDWRILEEVNALALDEGLLKPQAEHQNLVNDTLIRLVDKLNN